MKQKLRHFQFVSFHRITKIIKTDIAQYTKKLKKYIGIYFGANNKSLTVFHFILKMMHTAIFKSCC